MGRPAMTEAERVKSFYSKVTKGDGCWIWNGAKSWFGYGMIWDGRKRIKAHRYSYELYNGKIPKNMGILHKCNNPPCVNPSHIEIGTQAENSQDAIRAMTFPTCHKNGMAKLNPRQVREIRKLYLPWKFGCLKLSRLYKVSKRNITRIVSGNAWRHENYVTS